MTAWTVIATRSVGEAAWTPLPRAVVQPDIVPAWEAVGRLLSRVWTAGRIKTLSVRFK